MTSSGVNLDSGFWVRRYWTGADDPWLPTTLDERIKNGNLEIGWPVDAVDDIDVGDPVGIYVHGPGAQHGIYALGRVQKTHVSGAEPSTARVTLTKVEHSTTEPITNEPWILSQIGNKHRRVIYITPEVTQICDPGITCLQSGCFSCSFQRGLPTISESTLGTHPKGLDDYVPAYWVYARRSTAARQPDAVLKKASDLFYGFKYGETGLASFFATAIVSRLHAAHPELAELREKVALVPIPLDPAKTANDEPHRTLELAKSIKQLSGCGWRVSQELELTESFGKRKLLAEGKSMAQIRTELTKKLRVQEGSTGPKPECIILVDDVATSGMTFEVAASKLSQKYPRARILGVSAGQMTTKQAFAGSQSPQHLPTSASDIAKYEGGGSPILADMREHVLAYYGEGPWTEGALRSKRRADEWTRIQRVVKRTD